MNEKMFKGIFITEEQLQSTISECTHELSIEMAKDSPDVLLAITLTGMALNIKLNKKLFKEKEEANESNS